MFLEDRTRIGTDSLIHPDVKAHDSETNYNQVSMICWSVTVWLRSHIRAKKVDHEKNQVKSVWNWSFRLWCWSKTRGLSGFVSSASEIFSFRSFQVQNVSSVSSFFREQFVWGRGLMSDIQAMKAWTLPKSCCLQGTFHQSRSDTSKRFGCTDFCSQDFIRAETNPTLNPQTSSRSSGTVQTVRGPGWFRLK